ncbi:PREDICTED: proteasome subunit beta type-7-like [Fragaria vesca subsp. vesca]|uniref:proteasome subunit beta type-7-like n=1 Tax=Fragaria vesca subsp. vesca TaxID=101020 RepID=UPI0002C366FA|nr:PREDICTED: proteasome subunit beta type-7-like [Fragaria vesca subsp. vesca]
MGCGDSKFSSDLDQELKGTTLIGFAYSGGIILGAESRASNEREELLYPLRIRDDKDKVVQISSNIIYVVQGDEVDCGNMNDSMKQKFPYQGYTTPSVSCVVETMYNYQNSLDEKKGPQVHRVFLKNKRVVKERAGFPAALGSGQIFALDVLEGYYYNMTTEAAIELAFKALFRATY